MYIFSSINYLILLCECLLSHDGVEFVGAYLSVCVSVSTLDHLQQLGIYKLLYISCHN